CARDPTVGATQFYGLDSW
nr:immunoglobulin heavy chain junction region [Macaca mulatta]